MVAHRTRGGDGDAAIGVEGDGVGAPADGEGGADRAGVAACAGGGDGACTCGGVVAPREGIVGALGEGGTVGIDLGALIERDRRVRLDGGGVHHILVCQSIERGVGGGEGVGG